MKRRGDPGTANSFHSLEWLPYGYLQQGRYAAGRALIDTARAVVAGADLAHDIDARFVVADLMFGYAAASGRWEETAAMTLPELPPPSASRREQVFVRVARFQAGYAAAMRGDTATAMTVARAMRANLDALPATAPLRALLTLTTAEIESACALKRGDTERAIVLLREAARIDGAATPVGPSWYRRPPSCSAPSSRGLLRTSARRPPCTNQVLPRGPIVPRHGSASRAHAPRPAIARAPPGPPPRFGKTGTRRTRPRSHRRLASRVNRVGERVVLRAYGLTGWSWVQFPRSSALGL